MFDGPTLVALRIYQRRYMIVSRGCYLFELTPPVPIEVLEGNILGHLQEPIVSFRNVRYPDQEEGEEGDAGPPAADGAPAAPQTTGD